MKTRVIIIEDEPLATSIIENFLAEHPTYEIVAVCKNGIEGLKALEEERPDLCFLDVQMPGISGFEMLELTEFTPYVIFTTAFDEYAFQAFEANALDYLLKPFDKERFNRALRKFEDIRLAGELKEGLLGKQLPAREEDRNRIVVRKQNNIHVVQAARISFLEAYDDYVKIHVEGERFVKKQTLSAFEKQLTPGFIRVHRSFLVNEKKISRIINGSAQQIELEDGSIVPVSRSGLQKLKEILQQR